MTAWIIQIINYTLALFMWLIVGRLILSIFIGGRENFIMNFFIRFTEPVYKITGKIFPFARAGCIPYLSILIIIIVRILIFSLSGAGIPKQ